MSRSIRTTRRAGALAAVSLIKRRAWFEGEPPPTPPPTSPPTGTPPGQSGGTGGSEAKPTTFTQAELDEIAGRARKEGREKAMADFLRELGFEKPEDAKALVKSARERAEAEKTESQKAAEAREAAERERDALKQQLEAERQQRVIDRRDGAIRAKATGAHDPAAVLEWANRPANKEKLDKTVKEDGTVNDKAVDELIDACKKGAAYLFKPSGPGTPSHAGGRATPDQDAAAREANFRRMRRGH